MIKFKKLIILLIISILILFLFVSCSNPEEKSTADLSPQTLMNKKIIPYEYCMSGNNAYLSNLINNEGYIFESFCYDITLEMWYSIDRGEPPTFINNNMTGYTKIKYCDSFLITDDYYKIYLENQICINNDIISKLNRGEYLEINAVEKHDEYILSNASGSFNSKTVLFFSSANGNFSYNQEHFDAEYIGIAYLDYATIYIDLLESEYYQALEAINNGETYIYRIPSKNKIKF